MATIKKLFSLNESLAGELEKEVLESALDFYFDHTDSVVADNVTHDIKSGKMKVYDSSDVYEELGIKI